MLTTQYKIINGDSDTNQEEIFSIKRTLYYKICPKNIIPTSTDGNKGVNAEDQTCLMTRASRKILRKFEFHKKSDNIA